MTLLQDTINHAQAGVLSDPSEFAEYLTFTLATDSVNIAPILTAIADHARSIQQQDADACLSYTLGFSINGWRRIFNTQAQPLALKEFSAMTDGPRHFPATAGDIFVMIKSARIDLNFQLARAIRNALATAAKLDEDIQAYQYRDGRDMIDFVDGTENPVDQERAAAILVNDDNNYIGASYLTVQRYVEDLQAWNDISVSKQEQVIGRSKEDDQELRGADKPAYAHTHKSVVRTEAGTEIKMYRQNRSYGNALEHGTMFIGFAKSPDTIETSLRQMIIADQAGDYDQLLDFATAVTGNHYFIPPQSFLDSLR